LTYFGKGIYTLPTAAKILKINPQKMRRWVNGYTFYKNKVSQPGKPLINIEFGRDSSDTVISFLDLAELLFISKFIHYGISVQKIRKAANTASKILKTDHPFALQKMYTDGRSIFAELAQKENDTSFLDLLDSQYELREIIDSTLLGCIDFNEYNHAKRWWPLGKEGSIVLDPERNMGQPILNKYNVRTELLYGLFRTNHSISEICDWYELDENEVIVAIEYEKGLVA